MMKEIEMGWAKIQFERKQVNKTLVRCKNGKHKPKDQNRDRRKLERQYEFS